MQLASVVAIVAEVLVFVSGVLFVQRRSIHILAWLLLIIGSLVQGLVIKL